MVAPTMQPAPAPASAPTPRRVTWWTLLARTAGVWGRNVLVFTALGLVLDLPLVALELRGPPPEGSVAGDWLWPLLSLFIRMFAQAALSVGVLEFLNGGRPNLVDVLVVPARRLWPIFIVSLIYFALVALGLVALVLPGVFVFVAGYLAIPAVAAEPELGIEAVFRRSFVLTDGHRVELLAAFTILFGLEQGMAAAVGWAMQGPLKEHHLVGPGIMFAADALLAGLTACSAPVAYHDLRALKGLSDPRLRPSSED